MKKKPEAMPLSSLFVERRVEPLTPLDPAKCGVVVDLADTTMKRLKFELNLPTMAPNLRQAIEDERDRCATELATRQLKASPVNRKNASQPRKDKVHVTAEAIAAVRVEYMLKRQEEDDWPAGRDHGWIAYAAKELKVDRNTIKARMKAK